MMLPRSLLPATGASLSIAVVVLDAVFLFLAAVALAMRVWSRRISEQPLCLNDYLVICAWVLFFWKYSGASLELTAASLLPLGWLSHLLWVSPAFMEISLY